jgi:hypothetical protein
MINSIKIFGLCGAVCSFCQISYIFLFKTDTGGICPAAALAN